MFCPDGKADSVGPNPGLFQFLLCHLSVGGGRRMNDQRLYIRYIGEKGENFKLVDESLGIRRTSLDFKRKDGSPSLWKIFGIEGMVGTIRQGRMIHVFHPRMALQKINDPKCIGHMAFYAQRQGFQAL